MSMYEEHVILVNDYDESLGTMEKIEAHQKGILHRAFSIFILNENNEMLLQQRASNKYHSADLWTNACCSHPKAGESTINAAHRRLNEEMGFDCDLEPVFNFKYKAEVGRGLIEHEYDHVFAGTYNGTININTEEVKAYKFISLDNLQEKIHHHPSLFTKWFRIALPMLIKETKLYSS